MNVSTRDEEINEIRGCLPASAEEYADGSHFRDLFPLYPIDAPGVGRPGPDFDRMARAALGDPEPPLPLAGLTKEAKAAAVEANRASAAAYATRYEREVAYLYGRALYAPDFQLTVLIKGRRVQAPLLPGNFRRYLDDEGVARQMPGLGPHRTRVMVIGKCPTQQEVDGREVFTGKGNEPLERALDELGLNTTEVSTWYWTNAVKHPPVDPSATAFSAGQLNNMRPLLQQELRLVRPDYILCLGGVSATLVLGKGTTVDKMFGRVVDLDIPIGLTHGGPVHRARVMAILSPAEVCFHPENFGDLVIGLRAFRDLTRGDRVGALERDIRHVNVHSDRHLAGVVDAILARSTGVDVIAVDAEWHGDRPGEPGAYVRSIQFSVRAKEAYTVVLRRQGGVPSFSPCPEAALPHLRRLLCSTPTRKVRVGGHYLTADFPWLKAFGLHLDREYSVADTPELTRTEGGWDTYKMVHAVREQIEGGLKLENLAARFCGIPRYDHDLQAWKSSYCRTHDLKDKELGGYGFCPDHTLHSPYTAVAPNYAAYDSDACRRLFDVFNGVNGAPGLLDHDQYGNDCRSAFWHAHAATPAILEMESNGVGLSRERGDLLTDVFIESYDKLLAAFRSRIWWEDVVEPKRDRKGKPVVGPGGVPVMRLVSKGFNPGSTPHCRELLFGRDLNGAADKDTGVCKPQAPPGVEPLMLTPVMASGTRPEPWERVVDRDEVGVFWPSTGRESLGILSHSPGEAGKTVKMLRDLRFLAQSLKGTLRRPWVDADGVPVMARGIEDDEEVAGGQRIYDGGLMYHIGHDDRVRTHFGLVETGRWSSWGPNLHNISKRREEDYARIQGILEFDKDEDAWKPKGDYLKEYGSPQYQYPIRSILESRPGYLWVEADYKMAEMAIIGWLADDPTMIEHVRRNTLDEDDPGYLDLHSLTAITAFNLDTPENRALVVAKRDSGNPKWAKLRLAPDGSLVPTKLTLDALGRKALRVAAKNVNFGVPYGRSAEAIARQCREEGADVSVEDAQRLIDTYKVTNYPMIAALLDASAARVIDPGWMATPFGRYRRFSPTDDVKLLGEMQRTAMNFPIQSAVADAISLACRNLYRLRSRLGVRGSLDRWFDFNLQIHDALLFEVPIPALSWFLDDVLEEGMSRSVDIWPADLDGVRLPHITEPCHLAIDFEVARHWGEPLDREWALSAGVPEKTDGGHVLIPKARPKPPTQLILPRSLVA